MNDLIYDYIVIGTGPAGATAAKILSDDRDNSVFRMARSAADGVLNVLYY